jgi:tight adherence protein B
MVSVTNIAPFAIILGVMATAALVFYSLWNTVNTRATTQVRGLRSELERAGIRTKPEELVMGLLAAATVLWIGSVLLLHPPIIIAALLIPVAVLVVGGGSYMYIHYLIRKRINTFVEQLELSLRLVASSVRVGLGLRQAFTLVIEEMNEPSRSEFARVVGQTNIGVSILDALDDLAQRMPSNESMMMSRVIRVQSQTGGDLAKVLENLAATIKDRRRIHRKIQTLTAEGRLSAAILLLVPIGLGVFICLDQPKMGYALLNTGLGHIVLIVASFLELCGFLWLRQILQVKV